MRMRGWIGGVVAAAGVAIAASPALAWDAYGHKLITVLAIEGMKDAPAWVKAEKTKAADNSVVADRWRSTKVSQLHHANNPDHYMDVEDLAAYGMTLETMPPLRYEFVKDMTLAREKAGSAFKGRPVNELKDRYKTDAWPGFVPYAILESFGRVQVAFKVVRTLEAINDPERAEQLEAAKQTAIVQMGLMSHYVGDTAQPLHTTKHHHGWVGANPKGYTTDRGIHAYIDGGVIRLHKIKMSDVRPVCDFNKKVDPTDPWADVIVYLKRSHDEVEPLYVLEKSGELNQEVGKKFIVERLADGAAMLSALYQAAWTSAEPTPKEIEDFKRFDGQQLRD